MASIYQRLQFRRGTLADFNSYNPVLASGEPAYAVDGRILKIGDGQQTWTNLVGFHMDLDNSIMSGIAVFGSGQTLRASGAITTAINNLIDSAPATLDTLNEIAAAINDDANFIGTFLASGHAYTNALAGASGTLRADLTSASGALNNKIAVTSGILNNTIVVSGTNFLTDLTSTSGALNNKIVASSGSLMNTIVASGLVERADTIVSGTFIRSDIYGVSGVVDIVSGVAVFGSGQAALFGGRIDTLETNSGLLNTSVGVLETNSGLLNTSVGVLETNSGLLNTSVGVLETNSGLLNTSVGAVETRAGVLETNSGLLNTSVGVLETNSGLLNTSVGILETNSGLLNTTVGVLETSINGVSGILDIVSGIAVYGSGQAGGGGGSSTFVGLSDSPANFSGAASKFVKVNSSANALEFVAVGAGGSMDNVVEDTTPQLGGDLDINSKNITGAGSIDITGSGTFPSGISTLAGSGEFQAVSTVGSVLSGGSGVFEAGVFTLGASGEFEAVGVGKAANDLAGLDVETTSRTYGTRVDNDQHTSTGSGPSIHGAHITADNSVTTGASSTPNTTALTAQATAQNNKAHGNIIGVDSSVTTFSNLTNGASSVYGFRTSWSLDGGTLTNVYGLYLSNPHANDATITNAYGIYQVSPSDKNYFAGKVGVGNTSPGWQIDVAGSGRFIYSNGKCGLSIVDDGGDQSGIHIGDCALNANAAFAGIKHSHYTGNNDYMMVSENTNTYISAKDGGSVFIRGGGNAAEAEIRIHDVGAGSVGIVFNEAGSDRDIRMESVGSTNMFRLDASANRVGIGTSIPQHTLAISGTFNANEVNVSGSPAVFSSPTQAGDTASTNVSGVHNIVFTDAAGYSAVSKNEDTIYFVV